MRQISLFGRPRRFGVRPYERQELLDRLNAVPGIRLPPDAVSKSKPVLLKDLTREATAQFLAVMGWMAGELRTKA